MTGCEIGTFGKGCSNWCRGHCLNNVPCNSTTGHCDSGCDSGYVGPFCDKSMNAIIIFQFMTLSKISVLNVLKKRSSYL